MTRRGVPLVVALLALGACTEEPQTLETTRKADAHAYLGAAPAFTANGWKPGDAASWEQQMKNRAQGQNEYARTTP